MNLLHQLFQQGRYREVYDQSRNSLDPEIKLIHANAALELGEGSVAREVLENLPPFADPELEARRLFLLGWACLLLGDRETYHQRVQEAAQIHQGFPTLLRLTYTLPPDQGVTVLKEALARATTLQEEAQAAISLAQLMEPLGRLREGFAYASLAYLRTPDDPDVVLYYALLALAGGDSVVLENLVGLLEPIMASGNIVQQMRSRNLLADLYQLLGQPHKALEVVEENIRAVGKDHLSLICMVATRTYLALGMKDKALSLIRAAQLTHMPYARPQGQLQLALGIALYPSLEAELPLTQAMQIYGEEVPLGSLIARVYLAELRQEKLNQATLNQLDQWSENALKLYPPLLRAARQRGYRLRVLGSGQLEGSDGPIALRPRSLEVLALLLSRPQGWQGDEIGAALFGDNTPRSLKAEMHRLKKALGPLIQSRPWRITQPIAADFLEVRYWLERGEIGAALAAYGGPLLPHSQAPGIEELRHELEEVLRQAVLGSRDPELLFALAKVLPDDLELSEKLLETLPSRDWRSSVVASRVKRLRQSYQR